MSEQVTRPKNEGRVAASKRLAEWNRKNKENLLKNEGQVESSDNSSTQELQSQTSTVVYGSGALAVLAVIGVALYLYHEKKPVLMLKQHQHLSLTFFACVNLLINNEFYERNHGKSRVRSGFCDN